MKKKNSSMNQICYITIILFLFAFTLVGIKADGGLEIFTFEEDHGITLSGSLLTGQFAYDPGNDILGQYINDAIAAPIPQALATGSSGNLVGFAEFYAANSTAGGGGSSPIFEVEPDQQLTDQDGTVLPSGYYAFETDNSVFWQLIKMVSDPNNGGQYMPIPGPGGAPFAFQMTSGFNPNAYGLTQVSGPPAGGSSSWTDSGFVVNDRDGGSKVIWTNQSDYTVEVTNSNNEQVRIGLYVDSGNGSYQLLTNLTLNNLAVGQALTADQAYVITDDNGNDDPADDVYSLLFPTAAASWTDTTFVVNGRDGGSKTIWTDGTDFAVDIIDDKGTETTDDDVVNKVVLFVTGDGIKLTMVPANLSPDLVHIQTAGQQTPSDTNDDVYSLLFPPAGGAVPDVSQMVIVNLHQADGIPNDIGASISGTFAYDSADEQLIPVTFNPGDNSSTVVAAPSISVANLVPPFAARLTYGTLFFSSNNGQSVLYDPNDTGDHHGGDTGGDDHHLYDLSTMTIYELTPAAWPPTGPDPAIVINDANGNPVEFGFYAYDSGSEEFVEVSVDINGQISSLLMPALAAFAPINMTGVDLSGLAPYISPSTGSDDGGGNSDTGGGGQSPPASAIQALYTDDTVINHNDDVAADSTIRIKLPTGINMSDPGVLLACSGSTFGPQPAASDGQTVFDFNLGGYVQVGSDTNFTAYVVSSALPDDGTVDQYGNPNISWGTFFDDTDSYTSDSKIFTVNIVASGSGSGSGSATATVNLMQGVNMISVPLKPDTGFTAKSLSQHLAGNDLNTTDGNALETGESPSNGIDVSWVIRYDLSLGEFDAYVWSIDSDTKDGFPVQGGQGYIVHVSSNRSVDFSGQAWTGVLNTVTPPAAPSSLVSTNTWAFVVTGGLTEQMIGLGEQYVLRATNLTSGKELADVEYQGFSFRLPLVDLNRQDVVAEGDLVKVEVIGSNGKRIADTQFTVGQQEIATAHRLVELEYNPVPDLTRLLQNYPNPFNPETWIPFELSQDAEVSITIYDVSGKLVRTIEVGFQPAGIYSSQAKAAYWDGKTETGETVASGVYFYQIQIGDYSQTRRMVILK